MKVFYTFEITYHFSRNMHLAKSATLELRRRCQFLKWTFWLWRRRYYIWRYARVLDWQQYKVAGPVPFSPQLKAKIRAQIEEWQQTAPNSTEGKWLEVDAGLGYACFVSAEGEAFIEYWNEDLSPATEADRDRSVCGRTTALVLGLLNLPELATALPQRPPAAKNCSHCAGVGWHNVYLFYVICLICGGLGWRVWEGNIQKEREDSFT